MIPTSGLSFTSQFFGHNKSDARASVPLPSKLIRWRFKLVFTVVAALLLCLTCATSNAQGQTGEPRQPDFPGLDIQAVPGWDGYVDQSAPMPFSFLISNFSQDTIEGELTLTNPENDQTRNLGAIFIGPNGVRRFSSIQALPDWYQCIAKFSHEGRILWQRELALTTGKDFSEDLNYLLFVDDGSRMLQLPVTENTGGSAGRYVPKVGQGRAVQPLAVKTWQIPQHPGPLTVARAIVFSEATKLEMLNDAQWDAVGKWIGMGGTVFVSDKTADVIQRLKKAVPLAVQPSILFEELTVYRCGTGSIREYAGPLFSATDIQTPRQIAESTSHLPRYSAISMLESNDMSFWDNRNSDMTRMWVVTIFVVYTLLSGSTVFLFRMSRRNIVIFTSAVVGMTCLASVILGGFLRTSRGDLSWVTVTSAGPGGLLQLGKINVQSAGGRNTQMTVTGRHADLQLSESDETPYDYYYGYYSSRLSQPYFGAFTWQASRLTDEADAYQIQVPINPWGRRQIHATAFQPLERGLDIEISYSPQVERSAEQLAQYGPANALDGLIHVTATSSLPFELEDCHLLVARRQISSDVQRTIYYSGVSGDSQQMTSQEPQLAIALSMVGFGRLSPSKSLSVSIAPGLGQSVETISNRSSNGSLIGQLSFDGTTGIWIAAKIVKSPILSIDQQRSDFELMQEQHWYIQEVVPEQIPSEWRDLTQRLLQEQLKAAAEAQAAAKPDEN